MVRAVRTKDLAISLGSPSARMKIFRHICRATFLSHRNTPDPEFPVVSTSLITVESLIPAVTAPSTHARFALVAARWFGSYNLDSASLRPTSGIAAESSATAPNPSFRPRIDDLHSAPVCRLTTLERPLSLQGLNSTSIKSRIVAAETKYLATSLSTPVVWDVTNLNLTRICPCKRHAGRDPGPPFARRR